MKGIDGRQKRSRARTTMLLFGAMMLVTIHQTPGSQAAGYVPFAWNSAWNTPIPTNPALDPLSGPMVSRLNSGKHVANIRENGVPVWEADASTPRYRIVCTMALLWGPCRLQEELVPIPRGAFASPGSDAAMVVVDHSTGKSYEFWQYRWNAGRPTAGFGDILSTSGQGRPGTAVGAGVSRLAGVVRTFEIAQGRIDHALVFSTDNACKVGQRYPAAKTDGTSLRPDCIPEGARVQLDPHINLDTLGLSSAERTVAAALQTYGAYNVDNGGEKMAFVFEVPSGETLNYGDYGFKWDYWDMKKIPWSGLRVLKNWDGR